MILKIIRIILFSAFVGFLIPWEGYTAEPQHPLLKKADSLFNNEMYSHALEYFQRYLDMSRKMENPDWENISECYNYMGFSSFMLHQYYDAISYFEKALEIDRIEGNDSNIAANLGNIGSVYSAFGNYDKAVEYYKKAYEVDLSINNQSGLANTLNNIGSYFQTMGKDDSAIIYYEKAIGLEKEARNDSEIAIILNNIGLIYVRWKKYDKAIANFKEAMRLDEKTGEVQFIPSRLNNIGLAFYEQNAYDSALHYYNESLKRSILREDEVQVATAWNNIGAVNRSLKRYGKAIEHYYKAMDIYQKLDRMADLATVQSNIAQCYISTGEYELAMRFLDQSNAVAERSGLLERLLQNNLMYAEMYESTGNFMKSLQYFKEYSRLKDSLLTITMHQQIANFEVKYETEKKDKEIKLLQQNEAIQKLEIKKQKILKNSLFGGLSLAFLLILVFYWSLCQKRKDNRIIALEKEKSDKLLLNILPQSVASDLKEKGSTAPRKYSDVTILLSDIVSFTEISNHLDPEILISELNDLFTAFDLIIEEYHCVRIKTIGDAYMAVCGLPQSDPDHATNILEAAKGMISYLRNRNMNGKINWEIRIGIHTGEVVAGVVGIRKYIYDVFGDAINTAARLESNSEAMRINVSEQTYHLIRDKYQFTERGAIEAKGKGRIKMYYLV